MNPCVSVVIPAFNAEEFIRETLDSVLSQTFQDFEIIVVDDGSVDRTGDIVIEYGHPVRYIKTENHGPSHARNVGIRSSKGRYVAFLDADDLWTPEKLAVQISFLEQRQDVGFVFADMEMFNNDKITMPSYFQSLKDPLVRAKIPGHHDILDDPTSLLLKCNVVPTGTVVVRRDCLEHTELFDEKISNVEDLDLWIRLSLVCRFGCIPNVLKRKRDHQGNISKNRYKALSAAIYMCEKLSRNFPQFKDRYRREIMRRVSRHHGTFGYYYFQKNTMKKARPHLWKSLRHRPTARNAMLWCATFFPLSITNMIRRLKSTGTLRKTGIKGEKYN